MTSHKRASGIILHPTSLPNRYGIGSLGPEAYQWLDFLAESGCSYWQVLPLGPTGYGDSPYQCFSAFAGNPYLISLDVLQAEGLLPDGSLDSVPEFPQEQVDFGRLIPWKLNILDQAYAQFQDQAPAALRAEFLAFQKAEQSWLDDFAVFMALKEAHHGAPWPTWEAPLRGRDPLVLANVRQKFSESIQRQMFRQFLFFRQWSKLRSYASTKGIRLIGDAPIFVAHDSADVWAHPELFYLNKNGAPTVVAGVPPDYFSRTGQLWGNPLYRWDVHATTGYAWWVARLKAVLKLVDIIRLDHFRGFAGYWEVPAGMPTAEKGRWAPGPGMDFFTHLQTSLGELPLIAEDLGVITPDVVALRDGFNLPGMKILQFAFSSDAENQDLPHHYPANCVAYTGTHDNDTTWGWFRSAGKKEREYCLRYLNRGEQDIAWDMIRTVWASVAVLALTPMQDLLNLPAEARMNFPGRPSGNWAWRMPPNALTQELQNGLIEFNQVYGRSPKVEVKAEEAEQAEQEKTL